MMSYIFTKFEFIWFCFK